MLNVTAPCVVAAVAQRQLKSLCCLLITDTKTPRLFADVSVNIIQ